MIRPEDGRVVPVDDDDDDDDRAAYDPPDTLLAVA